MMEAPRRRPRGRRRRTATARHSVARQAAVQALYQIDFSGAPSAVVVPEFLQHRLGETDSEGGIAATANADLFGRLVQGVCERREELDSLLRPLLPADWPFSRLEVLMRTVLRLAAFELTARLEVPAAVVVTEYVALAHRFLSGPEPGMVNAILDRLARETRPGELEAHDGEPALPSG